VFQGIDQQWDPLLLAELAHIEHPRPVVIRRRTAPGLGVARVGQPLVARDVRGGFCQQARESLLRALGAHLLGIHAGRDHVTCAGWLDVQQVDSRRA
jgi:hypothetical protein